MNPFSVPEERKYMLIFTTYDGEDITQSDRTAIVDSRVIEPTPTKLIQGSTVNEPGVYEGVGDVCSQAMPGVWMLIEE